MSNRVHTKAIDRGTKFFNKYIWSVGWSQKQIHVLRGTLDYYKVEKNIANARYWEHKRHQRAWNKPHDDDLFKSEITERVVQEIHHVRKFLEAEPDCKRVLGSSSIIVYTNDIDTKDLLANYAKKHSYVDVRYANVVYPPNTIVKSNPLYKYRTYLRSREVTDQNIEILKNWLEAQQGEIVASPGLKNFIKNRKTSYYYPTNYTTDYHYFDHNNPMYPTMLRMVLPVAIRKTVPIIAK